MPKGRKFSQMVRQHTPNMSKNKAASFFKTKFMENVRFSDIDILKWGIDINLKGMLMEGKESETYLVLLPSETVQNMDIRIVRPDVEEWQQLNNQLDVTCTMGPDKVILRKSQRVLDQKICWAVYRRDKFKCRYCGIDNVPLTVDHIITWESGGATHEDNLLTSCRKCNKTRGNLDYGSWLQHKYYLGKAKYLSEEVKKRNDDIVFRLDSLPKNVVLKSR